MHHDRSDAVLEARLVSAIERNARLIVTLRHLAREVHRHATAPGHVATSDWAKCPHPTCRATLEAINGNATPVAMKANA